MRWKPTRAGIFNVWEYDDQVFDFGDGRLALRGRNGSGKSNALALLFPFILDGVMSAARMDPMGGGRSMKSLLLGRDDDDRAGRYRHDSGTGYVWMEFGDGSSYVTIGVGASATQHRDADPWFFVTSQRIGHDLELAENETPLGRRQLEERITDGMVFQKAEDYRTAVDRRLLGLGDSRYRRLVDLLLTLRRPHLAGKLDTDHLSSTLSAGLGELDPALIDDVAHSFDDLDAMQHELEDLAASLNAVERFLPVYRDHLVNVGRHRAGAVVEAIDAISNLDRELGHARRDLQAATVAREELSDERASVEKERDRLASEIESILLSPAYQDATALDEVRRSTDRARSEADRATSLAGKSVRQATQAVAEAHNAGEVADARLADVAGAITAWFEVARVAGIHTSTNSDFDDTWATSAIAQRRDDVGQVRRLARESNEATEKARHAEEHADRSLTKVGEAEREVANRRAAVSAEREELDALRAAWAAQLINATRPFTELATDQSLPDLEQLFGIAAAEIHADVEAAAEESIAAFHTADRRVGEFDRGLSMALDSAQRAVEAQRRLVTDLEEERRRVEHEPNPGPPPNPTRPDASAPDRVGVPMYVCVDFADDLTEGDRAGLEAALGAAGLLDALVTPHDGALDILDASINPAWAHDDSSGPSLADVLVPVVVDDLTIERIEAVLRSIPLSGDLVAFGTDGTWRLGPAVGRYAQANPMFIGHAARERRRAEQLVALDAQLSDERARLDHLRQQLASLIAISQTVQTLRSTQPPTKQLTQSLTSYRDWQRRLEDRQLTHAAAKDDAEAKLRSAESASLDLQRTASRLRLPPEVDALQGVEHLINDCDVKRREVSSLRKTSGIAAIAAQQAQKTADAFQRRADDDTATANDAEAFAQLERVRFEQLEASVGGDAQRAVEALSTSRRLHKLQEIAVEDVAGRLAETNNKVVRLSERIDGFTSNRVTLESALDSAVQSFEVICGAEVADVLNIDGVELGADRPTAARRLLAETSDRPGDTANRMERSYREILLDGLRAGHDPSMPKVDNVDVVRVGTADGDLAIGTLVRQLRDEYERTSQLLSKQEREIFETHLLTRVGDAIRQLLLDADAFEHHINQEMSRVPTESGMVVELRWEPTGDEPDLRSAIQALRTSPELLGPDRRDALRDFFMRRIADVRSAEPGRSFAETLTAVLDYRAWHQFVLYARFSSGKRQRVTRTFYRGLSGGEAATLLHLPLFAAAAAQYTTGSQQGPRLIALDEAFVGIDDKMRARLMGLLVQLDLDVILTSHEFWGFYDTVPALVLYDLVRRPPTPGVYAQRFDWVADTTSTAD